MSVFLKKKSSWILCISAACLIAITGVLSSISKLQQLNKNIYCLHDQLDQETSSLGIIKVKEQVSSAGDEGVALCGDNHADNGHLVVEEEEEQPVVQDDTSNPASSSSKNAGVDMDEIRLLHPGCFSGNFFDSNRSLKYESTMKYELIGKDVTRSERYNYLCPFIKNRYNCATRKKLEYGKNAADWKLTLLNEECMNDGGEHCFERCNLWNLIHDMKGPSGIGHEMLKNFNHGSNIKNSKEDDSINSQKPLRKKINVAIFGNSYMRQIFESFVCSWTHDMTYHVLEKGGTYDISLDRTRIRNNALITMSELGNMKPLPINIWNGTLCEISKVSQFYEEGLPTPYKCDGYQDNIAVAEFGGVLRIHYIFRPYTHENLNQLIETKWEVDPKDINVLIFNDGQEKTIRKNKQLLEAFEASGAWQRRILWPDMKFFEKLQRRDISQWFGANNPFINKPPDGHPCMPGVPDDEVNLIMYLMLFNASL